MGEEKEEEEEEDLGCLRNEAFIYGMEVKRGGGRRVLRVGLDWN